jgi:S-adenosyl-L-methionine hydrolase (adenosine-forming)
VPLPVTFLSDYGYEDEFAGICRAVIAGIAPDARVIDLTHGIARHAVRQGATALAGALPYAPVGVHLAVVDPGVGTPRRSVVAGTADGRYFVGPDNGLLWPAIDRFGGPTLAADVSLSRQRLEPISATFHGRDIFAPIAAHLANGTPPADLGEPLDPDELVRLELTEAFIDVGRRVVAHVSDLDRFGNASLDLAERRIPETGLRLGNRVWVEAAGVSLDAIYALTFADVPSGALITYLDSSGHLALAVNRGSAADRLGLRSGDEVVLRPA